MKKVLTSALMAATAACFVFPAASAAAATVNANTSGWINSVGDFNNPGFGSGIINNHFAGVEGPDFRNFFSFALPSGTISSATLNIFNRAPNSTIDPTAVYDVHGATSYDFGGLGAGVSFGNVLLTVANNGTDHFVSINLNAAGLAFLNAHAGGLANLGGIVTSVHNGGGCGDCVAVFGYNGGYPQAYLDISAAGGVPEASTWALLIVGMGAVGAAMRRGKKAVRYSFA